MGDTPDNGAADAAARENGRPPRDDLVRAIPTGGAELRSDGDDGNTLHGHFSVFNQWTEINSSWEGRFLERIAPGAAKKTLQERSPKILFNHGMDPALGDQIIASLRDVREDDEGVYYEARLLDGIPPLVLSGLRAGEYGASFRFSVMREDIVDRPEPSEHNPEGLRERTIKEMRIAEFGPVSFPAYPGASAGVRSLTDEFIVGRLTSDPERLRALINYLDDRDKRSTADLDSAAIAPESPGVPVIENATPAPSTEVERREPNPKDTPGPAPGTKPTPLYVAHNTHKKRGNRWHL